MSCASTPYYWRYDTPDELALLNQLWRLVSLRLNFFTPTRKAVGYTVAANGRGSASTTSRPPHGSGCRHPGCWTHNSSPPSPRAC